jgi:hypothetical protein
MKLGHITGHASGSSLQACHFLMLRFDEKYGFKPDAGESWIFQREGKTTSGLRGQLGWYTGLWRSPAGRAYVSVSSGDILVNRDPRPRAAPWETQHVRGTLSGIWGLHDELIFTWGLRGNGPVAYLFDGATWKELPAPPGEVVGMHGTSEKLVYAVGRDGLVARWDGTSWSKVVTPARGVLSQVFVVNDDEMYAVGPNRQLLQGSTRGWTEILEGPGPLFGVVKWKDDVWVGAAEHGLMKLAGTTLVPVKPNIKAEKLEARGSLLISSPQMIAGTDDGATFNAVPAVPFLAKLIEKNPPAWVNP